MPDPERFDVTMFGPDGNGKPVAANLGWWDAYCVAYRCAYSVTLRGVSVAIVHANTGQRQFTFGGNHG